MKYATCMNCDEVFELTGASLDEMGWHTTCPKCESSFDIDIEDYLVPQGTLVELKSGKRGIVSAWSDKQADEMGDIEYLITYHERGREMTAKVTRADFEIVDDWRKLRRTEYGVERVCHYPRNQEYSNVPCFNCVDRGKCNYDIYETLAEYEDTGIPPEVVAEYKKFEDELIASGLTFGKVIDIIKSHKAGMDEHRAHACPDCGHEWLELCDASDYPNYCPLCGKEIRK